MKKWKQLKKYYLKIPFISIFWLSNMYFLSFILKNKNPFLKNSNQTRPISIFLDL